jgi:hypothetical protein
MASPVKIAFSGQLPETPVALGDELFSIRLDEPIGMDNSSRLCNAEAVFVLYST